MTISFEDERAIQELYARAIQAFDAGSLDWLDFWADDPEFAFPGNPSSGMPAMKLTTRDALAGMIGQAHAMTQGRGLHHFTNFTFDQIGDEVRVRGYLILVVSEENLMAPSTIRQNTRIEDHVVQVGDKWLFKRRSVGATW
jgi:molybdopterin biosynthesis enzyme